MQSNAARLRTSVDLSGKEREEFLLKASGTVISILSLSALAILGSSAASGPKPAEALIFPPWWTEQRSFRSAVAGGPVLTMGGLPFVVIVPRASHPDWADGEWLRIPIAARMGCFGTGEES